MTGPPPSASLEMEQKLLKNLEDEGYVIHLHSVLRFVLELILSVQRGKWDSTTDKGTETFALASNRGEWHGNRTHATGVPQVCTSTHMQIGTHHTHSHSLTHSHTQHIHMQLHARARPATRMLPEQQQSPNLTRKLHSVPLQQPHAPRRCVCGWWKFGAILCTQMYFSCKVVRACCFLSHSWHYLHYVVVVLIVVFRCLCSRCYCWFHFWNAIVCLFVGLFVMLLYPGANTSPWCSVVVWKSRHKIVSTFLTSRPTFSR